MISGTDPKGRDYVHTDSGNGATVLDVRVSPLGEPLHVLVRTDDGIVSWMEYAEFDKTYARVAVEQPTRRTRRAGQLAGPDDMDTQWNDLLNQI